MSDPLDIDWIRSCSHLLPEPGPEVVQELCDEIGRLRAEKADLLIEHWDETSDLRAELESARRSNIEARVVNDSLRAKRDDLRARAEDAEAATKRADELWANEVNLWIERDAALGVARKNEMKRQRTEGGDDHES